MSVCKDHLFYISCSKASKELRKYCNNFCCLHKSDKLYLVKFEFEISKSVTNTLEIAHKNIQN